MVRAADMACHECGSRFQEPLRQQRAWAPREAPDAAARLGVLLWPDALRRNAAEKRVFARSRITADAGPPPGQHPVSSCEVIAGAVLQRADDRKLIGDFGLQRKKFGDFNARDIGFDRPPDAAIF